MYRECIHVTMKQTVLSFRASPRTVSKLADMTSQTNVSRSETMRIAIDTYLEGCRVENFLDDYQSTKKRDWAELEEFQRGPLDPDTDMFDI